MIKNSIGASAKADRVLSPAATEPVVSAHSGNAPLRALKGALTGLAFYFVGYGAFCLGELLARFPMHYVALAFVMTYGAVVGAFCCGRDE